MAGALQMHETGADFLLGPTTARISVPPIASTATYEPSGTVQSMPEYRGRTSLLVTSDHGRGSQLDDWSSHGEKVKGAEYIWMAAIGASVPARGEITNSETVHQRDVSATLLSLAGLDWREFCEDQGKPVRAIIQP